MITSSWNNFNASKMFQEQMNWQATNDLLLNHHNLILDHGRCDHGRCDHGRCDHGRYDHGRVVVIMIMMTWHLDWDIFTLKILIFFQNIFYGLANEIHDILKLKWCKTSKHFAKISLILQTFQLLHLVE